MPLRPEYVKELMETVKRKETEIIQLHFELKLLYEEVNRCLKEAFP
jgi:hypothetical protein